MKFTALALLVAVLFSDVAEGKKVKAKCVVEDAKEGDAVGFFRLSQRTNRKGVVRPIKAFGKFIFDAEDSDMDWSIKVYDDDTCTGSQVGDTVDVKEKARRNDQTRLKGKLGDGTLLLNTFAGYSIAVIDENGE